MKAKTKKRNVGGRPAGSKSPKPDGIDVLSAEQAADVAGVGVERVTKAIEGGGLAGASLGKGLGPRITRRAVLEWIERGAPEMAPAAPRNVITTPVSDD